MTHLSVAARQTDSELRRQFAQLQPEVLEAKIKALRDSRDELVIEAFRRGYGGTRIAQMSGLSVPRVYQIRDGYGERGESVPRGPAGGAPSLDRKFGGLNNGQRCLIRRAILDGASVHSQAVKYGVTDYIIRKIVTS